MQPYFLPYIGYFQLLNAVDVFVVYDEIQFTKKGWINRNRFILGGKEMLFTLPLEKSSDYTNIVDKRLSPDFEKSRDQTLRRIQAAYQKAPESESAFNVLEKIFGCEHRNLFEYILHSIEVISNEYDIATKIVISSDVHYKKELRGEERVLAICEALGATEYVNPSGGVDLYDSGHFQDRGIQLFFLRAGLTRYRQLNEVFTPSLSIIDVMMFNDKMSIEDMLNHYEILNA